MTINECIKSFCDKKLAQVKEKDWKTLGLQFDNVEEKSDREILYSIVKYFDILTTDLEIREEEKKLITQRNFRNKYGKNDIRNVIRTTYIKKFIKENY